MKHQAWKKANKAKLHSSNGAYRLRGMRLEDYPEVVALWKRTEGVGLNESDNLESIAFFLERNPGLSQVIEFDGEVAGAVLCGQDGRRGYLHHLAVATAHRGRGLGKQLVDACLKNLSELKILKCNIFLYASHAPGKSFWEHQGWAVRPDLHVMQRPTHIAITERRHDRHTC